MPKRKRRQWYAPWLHFALVGVAAGGAYFEIHHLGPLWAGVVVAMASRIAGALIDKVPPKRAPVDAGTMQERLDALQGEVNGQVHDLVNTLASFKAELDLLLDTYRRRLERLGQ